MTLPFSKVASIGDVLSTDRHILYFPEIPAVGDGEPLTLRHGTVSLPPIDVAQIIVHLFGWPVAFAGRRALTNSFSVDFVETTGAPMIKNLTLWSDVCSGIKTAGGSMKAEYAIDCEFTVKDTVGDASVKFKLLNVWPKTVDLPEFGEESAGMHIHCEFSFDGIDIVEVAYKTKSYGADDFEAGNSFDVLNFDERTGGVTRSSPIGNFGPNPIDNLVRRVPSPSLDLSATLRSLSRTFPTLGASLNSTFRF